MSQEESSELRHAAAATLASPPLRCPPYVQKLELGCRKPDAITENPRGRGERREEGRGGRRAKRERKGEEEEEVEEGGKWKETEGPAKNSTGCTHVKTRHGDVTPAMGKGYRQIPRVPQLARLDE